MPETFQYTVTFTIGKTSYTVTVDAASKDEVAQALASATIAQN